MVHSTISFIPQKRTINRCDNKFYWFCYRALLQKLMLMTFIYFSSNHAKRQQYVRHNKLAPPSALSEATTKRFQLSPDGWKTGGNNYAPKSPIVFRILFDELCVEIGILHCQHTSPIMFSNLKTLRALPYPNNFHHNLQRRIRQLSSTVFALFKTFPKPWWLICYRALSHDLTDNSCHLNYWSCDLITYKLHHTPLSTFHSSSLRPDL